MVRPLGIPLARGGEYFGIMVRTGPFEDALQEPPRLWLSPAEEPAATFLNAIARQSFHSNNNAVIKKNPPPTTPFINCVDPLNEM
jgi:hypothetical protein